MDYQAWSRQHLKRISLRELGKTTSVWCTEKSDKPLIVMVHGIGGDYAGLVPLAVELADSYRIAIIDLPGHGESSITRLPDAAALRQWFESALQNLTEKISEPAFIVAHSFGCSAVLGKETLKKHRVLLLNPVPEPSEIYRRYARLIMRSASFWAHIYNWRFFIYLRGRALLKMYTPDAKRRVRWVGKQSHPTFAQTVFQAGLVDMILDGSAYENASKVELICCGLSDTTAKQRDSLDMRGFFGDSKIVFLRGGHLLPIESPERVAEVLREVMVH
jgi:pimeloyl-ACP methyl ester carboxylesterase